MLSGGGNEICRPTHIYTHKVWHLDMLHAHPPIHLFTYSPILSLFSTPLPLYPVTILLLSPVSFPLSSFLSPLSSLFSPHSPLSFSPLSSLLSSVCPGDGCERWGLPGDVDDGGTDERHMEEGPPYAGELIVSSENDTPLLVLDTSQHSRFSVSEIFHWNSSTLRDLQPATCNLQPGTWNLEPEP